MGIVKIDRLSTEHVLRLKNLRLRSLKEDPDAFGTTWEKAKTYSHDDWIGQLTNLTTFFAVVDNCDVGMVRGVIDKDNHGHAHLISMWVAPEARKMGIAKKLIEELMSWARGNGLSQLLLEVAENNSPAIALYKKLGFVFTGQQRALPSPREYIIEKWSFI